VTRFVVEHVRAGAAALHDLQPSPRRQAWRCHVVRPALALGSTQPAGVVTADAANDDDVDLVRRRSGGSAVLLVPGEMIWLDVVVPRGDPLWSDDVADAMLWLGEVWRAALDPWFPRARVHRGAMIRPPLSSVVCFAGLGAGEVTDAAGSKLVGMSQRRTRAWVRLQSMCHLRWRPEWYRRLLGESLAGLEDALDRTAVATISDVCGDDGLAQIEASLAAALGHVPNG
jgi:lipoate-protein ligase A